MTTTTHTDALFRVTVRWQSDGGTLSHTFHKLMTADEAIDVAAECAPFGGIVTTQRV